MIVDIVTVPLIESIDRFAQAAGLNRLGGIEFYEHTPFVSLSSRLSGL